MAGSLAVRLRWAGSNTAVTRIRYAIVTACDGTRSGHIARSDDAIPTSGSPGADSDSRIAQHIPSPVTLTSMLPRLYRAISSSLSPQYPVRFPPIISDHGDRIFIPPFSPPAQNHGCQGSRRCTSTSLFAERTDCSPYLKNTISENKITIFSKSYCPYCKRAKALLTSKFPDTPTKILEYAYAKLDSSASAHMLSCRLDEMEEGSAIQSYLEEKTGQRTVPNIFISEFDTRLSGVQPADIMHAIDQKHVGGCDRVVGLDSQGKLASLVSA